MSTKIITVSATPPSESSGADYNKGAPLNAVEFDQNLVNFKAAIDGKMPLTGTAGAVAFGAVTATSGVFGSGTNTVQLGPKTVLFYNTGTSDGLIQSADDSSIFTNFSINKTKTALFANNIEVMRVQAGNVLIGTTDSLTSSKLDIKSDIPLGLVSSAFVSGVSGASLHTFFGGSGATAYAQISALSGGTLAAGTLSLQPYGQALIGSTVSATGGVAKCEINGGLYVGGNMSLTNTSNVFMHMTPASGAGVYFSNDRVGSSYTFRTSVSAAGDRDALVISSTGLSVTGGISASGVVLINTLSDNGTGAELQVNGPISIGWADSDPSGGNGTIYYDSANDRLRAFVAGAWKTITVS